MMLELLLAFACSLALVWFIIPHFIRFLKGLDFNQTVSEYSLEEYKEKAKTPILGGVVFVLVPVFLTVVMAGKRIISADVLVVLLTFIGYAMIGFADDFLIFIRKNNDGLSAKGKLMMQLMLAVAVFFAYRLNAALDVAIPFTGMKLPLGPFYIVLIMLMFSGASNAVNLTDGMDGLAAGCTVFSLIPYVIFAILQGKTVIAVFVVSLIGALIGYLYYNVKPAKIFMGDTGSLALGAVLAALSMVLKKELALILIGGVFVIETLCVMIQIVSVKVRHKRVFPYTPIHYAFVMYGRHTENQVVHMFWLVAALFSFLGLLVGLFS